MVRLLASLILNLIANAVGLVVASLILSGFSISGAAFVIAVGIFTIVEVVADPFITKIALTSVPALRGGVALITTFVGLLITSLVSDGIHITGLSTWVLATLIVWLFALIATLILPLIIFKKALNKAKN
jgi:putative membrane protein